MGHRERGIRRGHDRSSIMAGIRLDQCLSESFADAMDEGPM